MNKLVIKLNAVTENVTVGLISKLYTEAKAIKDYEELNDVLDSQVELLGNLLVVHAYGSDVTYLEAKFPNLHINVTGGTYVKFVDPLVLSILLSNNVGDGVGCTLLDLYNINSLSGDVFSGSSITSFNEFQYFNPAILLLANLFASCSSLTEITLPVGTTWIGQSWFDNCSNLVTINNTQSITSIYGLGGCSSLVSIDTPALTTVGNWGCMNCTSLTTIDLSHCTSINRNAFQGCTSLDNIDLSSCTTIGQEAFRGCTGLTEVDFNHNDVSTAWHSFYGCTSLTTIKNAENISTFGPNVFLNCTNLRTVTLKETANISEETFRDCSSLEYVNRIKFGKGFSGTLYGTFYNCTSLKCVDFDFSSTAYYNGTFYNCSSLLDLTTNDPTLINTGEQTYTFLGNKIIGATFFGCSLLQNKSFVFPNLTTIEGWSSFESCEAKSFSAPLLTSLGNKSFTGSSFLTVSIPSVNEIRGESFKNCTSLTNIDVSSCTIVGQEAFNGCTSLTSIDLSNVTSIGNLAFKECTSLSSVGQLNPNFTTIPNGCFRSCSSLTSIDLSNVTSVGGDYLAGAFAGCTSLINIGSLANVRHFGRECFKNCPIGTGQDLEITTTDTTWQGEQFYGTKYKSVVLHGSLLTAISSNGVYPAFNNMVNMEFIDLSDTAITSAGAYGYGTKTELIVHPSTITSVTWDALSYTNSNTTVKYIVILAETPPTLGDTRYTYLQKGNIYVKDSATVDAYKAAWPQYTYGSSNWDLHAHIKPLSELPVGVWKTGLYQLYEPYLSNSSDPAYATT